MQQQKEIDQILSQHSQASHVPEVQKQSQMLAPGPSQAAPSQSQAQPT